MSRGTVRWALLGLLASSLGCSNVAPWDAAPFCHVVLFKFRGSATDAQRAEMLQDARDLLAPIPSVKGVWAGRPAPTTNMTGVDSNYDVGILVTFGDLKGLTLYNDHPRHVDFVNKYRDKVEVRVFDFSPSGDLKP